ncbi:hypothetical protein B9Y74_12575 [Stenotrophomonas maltophilia]|nr:hypothetical protein B9Y74_12575 [Stenotrophomonas maltophilia]
MSTKVDTYQLPKVTDRHRETVRGGAVWACRTVGAMDGAIEPPWTGLRRVLQAHTTPPNKQKSQSRLLLRLWLRLLLLPLRVPGRRPGR